MIKGSIFLWVIFFVLIFLMTPIYAQVLDWDHTWGWAYGDAAYGVEASADGYVYVVGSTYNIQNGIGFDDAFIATYDKDGNLLWDRVWGTSIADETFRRLFVTANTIYAVGNSTNRQSRKIVASIAAFNRTTGNLLWDRDLDLGAYSQKASGVVYYSGLLPGLYVAGTAISAGQKAYIFILRLYGDYVSHFKKLSNPSDDIYYADDRIRRSRGSRMIANTQKGIFIPFGIGEDTGFGGIIALDFSLGLKWAKKYAAGDPALASDGEYLYLMSYVPPRVYKVDMDDGSVIWCKNIRYGDYTFLYDIWAGDIWTGDEGIYVTGGFIAGNQGEDAVLLKLSRNGEIIWDLKYHGSLGEEGLGVSAYGDDVYMVGLTSSSNRAVEDIDPVIFTDCTYGPQDYSIQVSDITQYTIQDSSAIVKDPGASQDSVVQSEAFIFHGVDLPDLRSFVRGMDDRIYMKSYHELSGWGGWVRIPGTTPSSPAAWRQGEITYMAVRGTDDKIYYGMLNEITGEFNGWYLVGGRTPSKPAITVDQSGNIYIVVRGSDNKIYINKKTQGGSWSGWRNISGSTPDSPAAAVVGNILHIVVRGMDNNIYHAKVDTNTLTMIGSWTRISGSTPSAPDLTEYDYKLYLAVRGTDNKIYINTFGGVSWSGWQKIPTGTTTLSPAIKILDGKTYVMVTGGQNTLWITYRDNTGWHSWQRISGSSPSGPELT